MMKTIILGAGKAPRLLPLTKDTPLYLLKVSNKSIIAHQAECLKAAGVDDILLITGPHADKATDELKNLSVSSEYNPFYETSGMAMTLWLVRDKLKDGFIFLYSDVLFDKEIISSLLKSKEDITLCVEKSNPREEAEKVVLGKDEKIQAISKAHLEGANGEFIGIARFSKKGAALIIQELEKIARSNLNATFITLIGNLMAGQNVVYSLDIGNYNFFDIDFPDDLKEAEKFF